ncbi:hypothetical protein F8M41_002165 [Gigaspora margarita]|uniref:Uncharacterized protein n=1 Tax=Gigaspora margarita TaxID=4874 RepID=A0A8H3XFQ6_GIGMA|nr:hypothetical protein F8M41_002165 [Gigaspora margarita]
MSQATTDKVFNTSELGPPNLTDTQTVNANNVLNTRELENINLTKFGYDPEKTPTDCITVCHPKEDNLRASTPITELFNDDKSALEVTISEDRNVNVKKHETNINCAPPISGYGIQCKQSI